MTLTCSQRLFPPPRHVSLPHPALGAPAPERRTCLSGLEEPLSLVPLPTQGPARGVPVSLCPFPLSSVAPWSSRSLAGTCRPLPGFLRRPGIDSSSVPGPPPAPLPSGLPRGSCLPLARRLALSAFAAKIKISGTDVISSKSSSAVFYHLVTKHVWLLFLGS